jgi:hypothetical protein
MSAPLLAGTDIEHASAETLSILTAPELIEINQDLGLDHLQGKYLGQLTSGQTPEKISTNSGHAAILIKCEGRTDQLWEFVSPDSGAALVQPPLDTSVHVRNQATSMLLDVPRCERAAEPYGPGPVIECGTGANSSCGDANQLWQFHANGTITTNVDGQCINAYGGTEKLQTFSCARQGSEANGLFRVSSSGEIKSKDGDRCLAVGALPNPSPPPSAVGEDELWAKPLSDGKRIAVLLLNGNDTHARDLTVSFEQLIITAAEVVVRDCWAQKQLGTIAGPSFTAKAVPPHGVAVLTMTAA